MIVGVQENNKPFHLMTPAERTAARIAQNRAIDEKIKEHRIEAKGDVKAKKPVGSSPSDFIRETPEERAARRGHLIRKVQS